MRAIMVVAPDGALKDLQACAQPLVVPFQVHRLAAAMHFSLSGVPGDLVTVIGDFTSELP